MINSNHLYIIIIFIISQLQGLSTQRALLLRTYASAFATCANCYHACWIGTTFMSMNTFDKLHLLWMNFSSNM